MNRSVSSLMIRRGLRERDACAYLGIDPDKFREWVATGKMPRPRLIDDKRVWDIDALNSAFDQLPVEGGNVKDTWADFDVGNQA